MVKLKEHPVKSLSLFDLGITKEDFSVSLTNLYESIGNTSKALNELLELYDSVVFRDDNELASLRKYYSSIVKATLGIIDFINSLESPLGHLNDITYQELNILQANEFLVSLKDNFSDDTIKEDLMSLLSLTFTQSRKYDLREVDKSNYLFSIRRVMLFLALTEDTFKGFINK